MRLKFQQLGALSNLISKRLSKPSLDSSTITEDLSPHLDPIYTLTDHLQLYKPDPVDWTNDCATAFATLKESLCSAPVLSPPGYSCPFILQTDASRFGIGAVFSQETENREEHPIAYYSRKMQPRERRYSATW